MVYVPMSKVDVLYEQRGMEVRGFYCENIGNSGKELCQVMFRASCIGIHSPSLCNNIKLRVQDDGLYMTLSQ